MGKAVGVSFIFANSVHLYTRQYSIFSLHSVYLRIELQFTNSFRSIVCQPHIQRNFFLSKSAKIGAVDLYLYLVKRDTKALFIWLTSLADIDDA